MTRQYIDVIFPTGTEQVEAEFKHVDVSMMQTDDAGTYLKHKPTLTPVPIIGWSFHQLASGEWIAISDGVSVGVKMEPRKYYTPDDDLDV